MPLDRFHSWAPDGVRWRLTPLGLEIEGGTIERTKGPPRTAARVWSSYESLIESAAGRYRVPTALIMATICTESGGNPDATRLEPGYRSDEETPRKCSFGLMQTLLSTAQATLRMCFDRHYLLDPRGSIEAGTSYLAEQAATTGFDPPLVAAAYNAGSLRRNDGQQNRWKLHQYRVGTGEHCDRFVRFFNDTYAMWAETGVEPAVPMRVSYAPPAPPSAGAPDIRFGTHAVREAVSSYSLTVIADLLRAIRCRSCTITSTQRSVEDQARVMFDNCERHGAASQRALYGSYGDQVIDVYSAHRGRDATRTDTIAAMARRIREVGPTRVSRHVGDPKTLNVVDIAPSSIGDRAGFARCARADTRISYFLEPPKDPAFHLEIPQPT